MIAYVPILPAMIKFNEKLPLFVPNFSHIIMGVYQYFFAKGLLGLVTALFLIAGTYASLKKKSGIVTLWLWIFIPIIVFKILTFSNHAYGAARHLNIIIPPLLIIIAEGIMFLSQSLIPKKGRILALVTSFFLIIVIISWIPRLEYVFLIRSNERWVDIAKFIKSEYKPSEIVIVKCGSSYSHRNLEPYFFKTDYERVYNKRFFSYLKNNKSKKGKKLILINESPFHLKPKKAKNILFGRLQVVVYSNFYDRETMKRIRSDLINATKYKISTHLSSFYWLILDFSEFLKMYQNLEKIQKLGEESDKSKMRLMTIYGYGGFRKKIIKDAQAWLKNLSKDLSLEEVNSLESLYLRNTKVTDTDLVYLKELKNLDSLSLRGTKITSQGLAHLKTLKTLRWLDLSATKITGVGLVHLKILNNLTFLFLNGTRVTDANLVYLKSFINLKRLNLGFTQITDAGLIHLKSLKNLRWIRLYKTKVTDAGIKELKKALPNCNIQVDK